MKRKCLTIVYAMIAFTATSQGDTLFSTKEPLNIGFSISIKSIKNAKEDSVYFKNKMYYQNAAGVTDSIKIGLRRRGNFRLRECYFPPLWMKIEKKNSKHTLFEGNKKLKVVLPCKTGPGSNDLILKEYLCYKLYEAITPYAFKTRLANIDFTDERGKKNKDFQLKGILIEDVDKTAKRLQAKAVSEAKVHASALNDTCALRFDLFQLLISNTDWSKGFQHNSKLIYRDSKYIPIPYDFDMSGVVDAPYAVVSKVGDEQLPIESVRERYYRGFCASKETTQFIRNEFLANKEKLLAVPDELTGILPVKEIENIKSYLNEFFEILKYDYSFEAEVISNCRAR